MSVDKTSTKRFARVAILTISDTRCFETDTSGSWLQEAVEAEGHEALAQHDCQIRDLDPESHLHA